jgi:hypothetical protein
VIHPGGREGESVRRMVHSHPSDSHAPGGTLCTHVLCTSLSPVIRPAAGKHVNMFLSGSWNAVGVAKSHDAP